MDLFQIVKNTSFAEGWRELFTQDDVLSNLELISENINNRSDSDIVPLPEHIFRAFELTPLPGIKVVILGQDPYPTLDDDGLPTAQGLSFSVRNSSKIPPSLKNIFTELKDEYPNFEPYNRGDLTHWAVQGVLLLNSALTCQLGKPESHLKMGWMMIVKNVIEALPDDTIFVLWGKKAQDLVESIGLSKNAVLLKSAHPSPFSVKGFYGCNHFRQINEILESRGQIPIMWGKNI